MSEDPFLDDTVYDIDSGDEEEREPFVGQFVAYITSANITKDYISKSGNKQTKIDIVWQILPSPNDKGWGKAKKYGWYYSAGMFTLNEMFRAIDLPYDEDKKNLTKKGKPRKKWKLSVTNLVGRGCLLELEKPEGSKYSEITCHYNVPDLKVLKPDEIMEIFAEDDDQNSDLPF